MARTGISVLFSDTRLGQPAVGDGCHMIVGFGVAMDNAPSTPFTLDTPFLLWGVSDLNQFGTTVVNGVQEPTFKTSNPGLYAHVVRYYASARKDCPLWIVGHNFIDATTTPGTPAYVAPTIQSYVEKTVVDGWAYHPVLVGIVLDSQRADVEKTFGMLADTAGNAPQLSTYLDDIQKQLNDTFTAGYRLSAIADAMSINHTGDVNAVVSGMLDLNTLLDGDVCACICDFLADDGEYYCAASLAMGEKARRGYEVSVGSMDYAEVAPKLYMPDTNAGAPVHTDVNLLTKFAKDELGRNQWFFARMREQAEGVYFNDEGTAANLNNANSELYMSMIKNKACDALEGVYVKTTETDFPEYDRDGHLTESSKIQIEKMGIDAILNGVRGVIRARARDNENNLTVYEAGPNYVSSRKYIVKMKIVVLRKNKEQEIELTYEV